MTRCHARSVFFLAVGGLLALGAGQFVHLAEAQQAALPDLSEYRTVDQAVSARISKALPTAASVAGYLGIHAVPDANGKLVIGHVEAESPAAKAGLKEGDQVASVAGQPVPNSDILRELLKAKAPGDE